MSDKRAKNLIPGNKRSQNEARENGKKGGIESGKTRRKKALQKDWLKVILSMQPDTYGKLGSQLVKMGFEQEDIESVTNDAIITAALFQQAVKGDMKAIEYIDKRMGRNPDMLLRERELDIKAKEAEARQKIVNKNDLSKIVFTGEEDISE